MVRISKTQSPIPLNTEETHLYKYLVKYLKGQNAFNEVDGLTIAQAVKCYFRTIKFEKEADLNGWVQEFENGSNLSPHATLFYREAKRWDDYCKQLGLTVKARDTIKVFKADDGSQKGFLRSLAALHKEAANG